MKDKRIIGICKWQPIDMANRKLIKIRPLIALLFAFATIRVGYAQDIDHFVVGPFEVAYMGEGDFKYRLRNGVDLYDFFGLERDTIIKKEEVEYKHGVQVDVFMALPKKANKGTSNAFGLSGSWKQQIGRMTYLNAGLSLCFSSGEYSNASKNNPYNRKDKMLELGLPVSVELTNLDDNKPSLYAGVGFIPAFYSTIKVDETSSMNTKNKGEKDYGFLVSPRIDFGGYIPLGSQILRVGIYGEYKICCFQNINIYKKRVSNALLGVNAGLIF